MTVTKAQLADSVHKRVGLGKSSSTRLICSLFEIMKGTLAGGENILISGFGKFSVNGRKVKGRGPGKSQRQPYFGKEITFKCSPVLSDKINRKRGSTIR